MSFNPRFAELQAYPFERLRELTGDVSANQAFAHIPLSLGEPKHTPPEFVIDALTDRAVLAALLAQYPATKGSDALRQAIAAWFARRFATAIDADHEVLPVNGTREALFSFAQAMLSGRADTAVMMPNPFYQIYEGAALLAGAAPVYVNNEPTNDYHQDFTDIDAAVWRRTELVYICSPGNPTGHVMPPRELEALIELAHRYDFIVAADECYSEIYLDDTQPPTSLLAVSEAAGNADFSRCVVFHSLSKRSNLPGLRSGFVAGDAQLLRTYLKYRTYHGCALGAHHQLASTLAWQDEAHVQINRDAYRKKFKAVSEILAPVFTLRQPSGGFYHWLSTPVDDLTFCRGLLETHNVTVMPGSFLGRTTASGNPGADHVRVAWVAKPEDCSEAARRLAAFAKHL